MRSLLLACVLVSCSVSGHSNLRDILMNYFKQYFQLGPEISYALGGVGLLLPFFMLRSLFL